MAITLAMKPIGITLHPTPTNGPVFRSATRHYKLVGDSHIGASEKEGLTSCAYINVFFIIHIISTWYVWPCIVCLYLFVSRMILLPSLFSFPYLYFFFLSFFLSTSLLNFSAPVLRATFDSASLLICLKSSLFHYLWSWQCACHVRRRTSTTCHPEHVTFFFAGISFIGLLKNLRQTLFIGLIFSLYVSFLHVEADLTFFLSLKGLSTVLLLSSFVLDLAKWSRI